MSVNQSRAEKTDPTQYRKTGRYGNSGSHRNYSGGGGKGGGASTAPPPSSYSNINPQFSSNRSFKKPVNAQGAQSRVAGGNANLNSSNSAAVAASAASTSARGVQNGAHSQLPSHGGSDAPVSVKPNATSAQKSSMGLPKAPAQNISTVNSSGIPPSDPAKGSGGIPLQFGSISAGLMQVPARTSSAPPYLDEQKREQARYDSLRAVPVLPTQSIPIQYMPTKNSVSVDQSNAVETPPMSRARRDIQVSASPHTTQTQKPSVHPIPGMPMQMSFHQPHIPVQFGGPNPQLQSQGMINSSIPMAMAMPLPMGNPSQVQQQVYVQGLQPHMMHSQGVVHHGPSINFSSQMGGNMGINTSPQFSQQRPGIFGGARRTVKITHPETHEELSLNRKSETFTEAGSAAPRLHPNAPSHSQPISSFPPGHPINYYPNSYSQGSVFFTSPSSLPSTSTQITSGSQAPRVYNQITVKPAANPRGEKIAISSLPVSSPAIEKISPSISIQHGEATSLHTQRDPENITEKLLQQSKSTSIPIPSEPTIGVSVSAVSPVTNSFSSTSAFAEHTTSVSSSTSIGTRSDMFNRSNSSKYDDKKPGDKSHSLMQNQLGQQSTSASTSSAETVENTKSSPSSETAEPIQEAARALNKTGVVPAELELDIDSTKIQGTRELAVDGADTSQISVRPSMHNEKPKHEDVGDQEREDTFPDASKEGATRYATNPEPTSLKPESLDKTESPVLELKEKHQKLEKEPVLHCEGEADGDVSTSTSAEMENLTAETSSLCLGVSISVDGDKTSTTDASTSNDDALGSTEGSNTGSGMLDQKSSILSGPSHSEPACEIEVTNGESTELISTSTDSKDKPAIATNIPKITIARGRQKRKEALQKADRAGTASDLYMAYKGPEEKNESFANVESSDTISSHSKEVSIVTLQKDTPNESKAEPDDWEDVADLSTPKLETSDDRKQVAGIKDIEDGNSSARKYSRDFLLKFSEQCKDLPQGFEITSDGAEPMIMASRNVTREMLPSPGRNLDRSMGGSRSGRRGSGMGDDDKWSKQPGPLPSPRDLRLDIGYGNNVVFQSAQGGNFGVLRNPRAQSPVLYPGGILSGPMHSMGPHAAMQRTNSDSDRWQRATGYQRGLMPSPQTPLQVMHKADRKYEVGKITDEEQAKQRQLKGILNKLTPQNFEKLFEQVKQVNIDNAGTLTGVISQIFDKALMEPTFCEMYANFCYHLAGELPDFSEDNEKITFKRLLLNKCQEEFERGEREQEEANRAEEEGDAKLSDEEREEKRVQARRRMLGNIRLIGELYKKRMLTEKIMHGCIQKLLGQYQNPDEEDVEALCKLMSTIGEMIDHPKAKEHMDAYFDMMVKLSNNMKLSSRVRFMLKDSIDLRKNKWQQRRKIEGPKKIDEVHRDAANERQAQANRLARGPSMGSSYRRGQQTMEFAPRGSNVLLSPNSQMGGFRGMPQQPRGYAMQDVRMDERHPFENRTLSVPLPQRPLGDETVTLGPQGGLAKGMSTRGQPPMSNIPFSDMQSPDSRRTITGLNGYGSVSDRPAYASREELIPRFAPDRFAGPAAHDQINSMDGKFSHGSREVHNPDPLFNRSRSNTPPTRSKELSSVENLPSEKVGAEEQLRKMSMETIKEFYSSNDKKEVALCVKDLNAPSFYPSMLSIWVSDSFERKDMERDLLAKLLVNLTKSQDALLSQAQLVEGFESVLAGLEDAVNDAPRAAEFLGGIFAKLILENVLPLTEIGRLIYEGGEEQGRLVEVGLAAELLGSILEVIKRDKGDSALNEICAGSNLRLENFRPPNSKKPLRLDKFI